MLKRMIAMMLSLLMLAAVLPVAASAETTKELCTRIEEDYQKALVDAGRESLEGHCGELASWQLFYSGINTYRLGSDGNRYYDTYCNMGVTSGGYRPKAYGMPEYDLEQALNEITKNGLQDVYNIVVGFEKTNTVEGQIYGHAVYVYAIIGGLIYFTESFDDSVGFTEGKAIKLTIPEFVKYYHDWVEFEGIIVFGQKGYESQCKQYASDLFAEATVETVIMSQPCAQDSKKAQSKPLRQVKQAERLLVTGLIENTEGQFYYRVEDCGSVGYVDATTVIPLRFNYEQILLENPQLPQVLETGKDFTLGGILTAKQGAFCTVDVEITDINDRVVMRHSKETERTFFDLSNGSYNAKLEFGKLEKGYYSYDLYATGVNHYLHNGVLTTATQRVCLLRQPFRVGKNLPDYLKTSKSGEKIEQNRTGWYYEQENWHYYDHGQPKTGWFNYKGIDYYLQADGGVTIGMATLDDGTYFFTETGTRLTGWQDTARGTCYFNEDGKAAKGWQTIEGRKYFFTPDGVMLRDCWFSQGKEFYYLLSDGSAAVGWIQLPEGSFCFRADGKLRDQNQKIDTFVIQSEYS